MATHMHNSYNLVKNNTGFPADAKGYLTLTLKKTLGRRKRPQIKDFKKHVFLRGHKHSRKHGKELV